MFFQTEQIKLRPFELDDAPALRAFINHPKLSGRRYIPQGYPGEVPLSMDQVESIIKKWGAEKREAHLGIDLTDKQELIGHAEFEWSWDPLAPWISVVIARPYQRRGYGTQVAQLILSYLFENSPTHSVSGWMADWNRAARSFARRLGFKENGRSRREGYRQGAYYDGILVDILRSEYQSAGGMNYAVGR